MKARYIILSAVIAVIAGCAAHTHQDGRPQTGIPVASEPIPATRQAQAQPAALSLPRRFPPVLGVGYAQPLSGVGSRFAHAPELTPAWEDYMRVTSDSIRVAKRGDAQVRRGDWTQASAFYQRALRLFPGNLLALDGMARCAEQAGHPAAAIPYYRRVVYCNNPMQSHDGWGQGAFGRLMRYALVLDETGHTAEALRVYNRAAHFFNYGTETTPTRGLVLLPQIGNAPSQEAYTPRHLEAMVRIGIYYDNADPDPSQLREAAALDPNSAVAQYYLGKYLLGRNNAAAKAALERAVQLGDDRTAAAARVYLADIQGP